MTRSIVYTVQCTQHTAHSTMYTVLIWKSSKFLDQDNISLIHYYWGTKDGIMSWSELPKQYGIFCLAWAKFSGLWQYRTKSAVHRPIVMRNQQQNSLVLDNVLSLLNASVHHPKIFSLHKSFRNITTTTCEPFENERLGGLSVLLVGHPDPLTA